MTVASNAPTLPRREKTAQPSWKNAKEWGYFDGNSAVRGRSLRMATPPKPEHAQSLAERYAAEALATCFKIAILERRVNREGGPWTWPQQSIDMWIAQYCEGFLTAYHHAFVNPTWRDCWQDVRWCLRNLLRRS